ncbi:MAG: DUF4863 family protein [Burkholderiaceae bacterium]|jgi:hypothetical protein
MSIEAFRRHIGQITAAIAQRPLDTVLDRYLNAEWGEHTPEFKQLRADCLDGVAQGWLCTREAGGIRYGRVFKPEAGLSGFSVDVVDMKDISGPHHSHPNGEIDLIMPIEGEALFDNRPAGWLVCPPGSAHRPTVSNGRALVLYLLPDGQIEFSK